MARIEINLELDALQPEDAALIADILNVVNGAKVADDTPQSPGPAPEEKPKRKRRTKAEIQAEKDAAAAEAAKAKEPPPEEDDLVGDADHNVTMDDLRQALSAKVTDHRPAIKKKLTALGVKKLTEIEKSGWPAVLEFLTNLD